MPVSSTAPRNLCDVSSRKRSSGTPISISGPQRKGSLAPATTSGSSRLASKQKVVYSRRETRNSRLSDRWPMLNKIIRGNRTTAMYSTTDNSDTVDEGEEDDVVFILPCDSDQPDMPIYAQRVVHPTSPRFPSPLSGVEPVFRENAPRHGYIHHGVSYSALSHWRELWRKRKMEWEDYEYLLWQAGLTTEEAYAGLMEDSQRSDQELSALLQNCPWKSASPSLPDKLTISPPLNPATFPRLGDLSSLRDSFLISVDTWFSDFPLWTLSKLIWIYDINFRSSREPSCADVLARKQSRSEILEDFGTVDRLKVRSLSSLTGSSDSTLVNTSTEEFIDDTDLSNNNSTTRDSNDHPRKLYSTKSCDQQPWETCWFNRWEVLYHEVSLAADIAAASESCASSCNGSKEAARIIFTSPSLLHDPHDNQSCLDETFVSVEITPESPSQLAMAQINHVMPLEDEEEDYGEVISPAESKFRPGALLDPMSMFATAKPLEFDDNGSYNGGEEELEIMPTDASITHSPNDAEALSDVIISLSQLHLCS